MIGAARAAGAGCCLARNQQAQFAQFMSTDPGYASTFDGELHSCNLGAAKPGERCFELALKAAGADAGSTLSIDDRPENVAGAQRAGIQSLVCAGRSGAAMLKCHLRDSGINVP